jgi:hypothetical protein
MEVLQENKQLYSKAVSLKEIVTLKNRTQIPKDFIHSFYVPQTSIQEPSTKDKITCFFEASRDIPQKLIVAGSKGTGKSTLFCHLIHKGLDHFHIVPIHLLRTLNPMDISQVDIIFCLLNHLIEDLSQTQQRIDPFILNTIYQCLHDEQIIGLIKFKKSEAGDEEGTKIGFIKTIIAAIVEALSTSGSNIRTQLRNALDPGLRLIIKGIQEIIFYFNRIYQKDNKMLLIIFDDLDQFDLTTAEQFFQNHLPITERLNVHIIYTMPDFIRFSSFFHTFSSRMDRIFYMRMTPVNDNQQGQDFIKKIISLRIDLQLIPESMLDQLIVISGGVLSHVFNLIIDTALETLMMDSSSQCMIHETFNVVLHQYQQQLIQQMDSDQIKLLSQLDLSKPFWSGNKLIQQLMAQNILIEYEYQGDVWFDMHPLVKSYIKSV